MLSKGAGGRSQQSYNDLAKVLSVSATQNEIKAAMVGREDFQFLDNISELVKNSLPEFADVFAEMVNLWGDAPEEEEHLDAKTSGNDTSK